MQLFANNAASELAGDVASGAATLTLKAGGGALFPSPTGGDFFLVTLYQKVGAEEVNHEIVKCTARNGDVLTVVRAQEGTTARAFANADPVDLRATAGTLASKADVASAYVHPVNHPASIITQDASNRFVTDAEKTAWNAKGDVTLAGSQNLTNKTIEAGVLTNGYTEEVFAVTGASPAISSANGSIQTWVLSGNSTPTDSLANGQSITIGIDDGSAFTVTWPSVTWTTTPASAPTLATTGLTWVALWKVDGVLYGKY